MENNNKSTPLPPSVDVLIVGFGPVGAALAALLGRYHVNAVVIDKRHEILRMPRAIALDNEALRMLQLIGLPEDAFDKLVIPEVKMHCPLVGQFSRANTSGCIDGHPKLVTFYQPDLENALRSRLLQYPCITTCTGYELQDVQQHGDHVEAFLLDEDGMTFTVNAKYLIGADGAGSRVRTLIGQDFTGQTYAEDWLIVDANGRQGQAIDHVEFLCDHRRPTPHMPAPGGRERWEFMLHPGETREEMEQPHRIAQLLAPGVKAADLSIERTAVYRFHARCCDSFQKGRVFLIGDAAHITPPFVGQGLVAGLRDACNLGWKLAWVLDGRAAPRILGSYDQERRPHAKEMIDLAKLMGRAVMPRNAVVALLIHGLMKSLTLFPPARRLFEELDIKPKNRFKKGLFSTQRKTKSLPVGGLLNQCLVRDPIHGIVLSDDVLGDQMTLIGFGNDPRQLLETATQERWQAHGGGYLQIVQRGQRGNPGTHWVEDLSGELLKCLPKNTLLIVRPDRIVMHSGGADHANELANACMALLDN
ncbi:bifunctional 3-(3-hydroxy-phenyl)propionate/3-hydroxycinnamic acid hydroxylase [Pseudomonas sp. VS38]|uniref:bifunctional 3-(3-hydroxy-phenyl)propionate/3-hydroxycinnamic acid hydroxylase n=1 Tax=Pseudomonas sp. VS38 TaxID=2834066 RepID=UPI001BDED3AF|nr:bifunctional 3-(3-hydroxy-phenyl)propionate/3-hydroxycinnamic acid hydroxylase [Pseudomonas sp. VS38]MBT1265490.1 bifunctional 3-(3-hydroxy-phenyl)propionate/3-hydroxycinnamic acid hydroxylase [Pseudomonas sp. VS38]